MRILNDRLDVSAELVRRTATVEWEESPRPPAEIYFETGSSRTADISDSFDPFLLAAALAARRHGEKRVQVAGRLCPRLAEGVRTAFAILDAWYTGQRPAPALEAAGGFRPAFRGRFQAAIWLTSGVDSLHALRENRRMYPAAHPRSFRRAIYAPNLNFPDGDALPRARDLARRQIAAARATADETDLELVVVGSNQRVLEPDTAFPGREALGSLLAATAHFQAAGIASSTVAASFDVTELMPWGTHPLLDPLYSSAGLDIEHRGWRQPRLDKIRSLAAWRPFRHLFVCFEGPLPEGQANCGRCEKCLRTMAALAAVGKLAGHPAFPFDEVHPRMLLDVDAGYHPELFALSWEPIAVAAAEGGRADLARAIRRRIGRARGDSRGWKALARRWGSRANGDTAAAMWRRFRPRSSGAAGR